MVTHVKRYTQRVKSMRGSQLSPNAGDLVENLAVKASGRAVSITYQGNTFNGNNQQILLEQLEQQGFRVAYCCRVGICESCKLTLLAGKVQALNASGIGKNNRILACSCIPIADLVVE